MSNIPPTAPHKDKKAALVLGGRTGLLGQALTAALNSAGWKAVPLGRDDLDCTDEAALGDLMETHQPAALFNAIAYTAVDQAEDEPDAAKALNRNLPAKLARLCRRGGVKLVHYSTDFVFDGRAETPYAPGDPTGPMSEYGRTKLQGEKAIAEVNPPGALIIRTSWLFGPGKANFVAKILQLAAERSELNVVHDQVGSPSYTPDLAANSIALVEAGAEGIHHLACSGRASWCELAAEAVALAGLPCAIRPIPSSAYPQKAARPPYSVLDVSAFTQATGIKPRPWPQALRDYVYTDLGLA